MAEITINRLRGFYEKVTSFPSGYTNDGIFGITVPSGPAAGNYIRIKKGPISSQEAGILYDGTDQTAKINAALAVSGVNELHFDSSDATDITVSGTLNCGGKKLVFRNHNKIIGTNTIDNFVLDCALTDQCFTISSTLTNVKTIYPQFTCEYFGAQGNGSDESAILQKTSDTVIKNTSLPRVIKLFCGKNYATQGWVLHNWDGTKYNQYTLSLVGEDNSAGGNSSFTARITSLNPNSFGIAVQRATGFTIKGIHLVGQLVIPGAGDLVEYYTRNYATFASANGVRDDRYSPYSGIVLDPFRNRPVLPTGGGYPDWNGTVTTLNPLGINWYRGPGGFDQTGGCTAGVMQDLLVDGFTVGIMSSPNGETQQGENMLIHKFTANNVKAATGWGQRESKDCFLKEGYSYDRVYNIIDGDSWGVGQGTLPYVKGYDVAGSVIQILTGSNQHVVTFEDIYTEFIYRIGDFAGNVSPVEFIGCNFVFGSPPLIPPSHFSGKNVTFRGCTIRYYDDLFNKRAVIQGFGFKFDDCYFDLPPLTTSGFGVSGDQHMNPSEFYHCKIQDSGVVSLGCTTLKGAYVSRVADPIPHGKFTVENAYYGSPPYQILYSFDCGSYESISFAAVSTSCTINSTAHTAVVNFGGHSSIRPGQYILFLSSGIFQVLGRISAVNRTTNDISIVDVPIYLPNGSFPFVQFIISDYNSFTGRYVGDYTFNSQFITNVFGDVSVGTADRQTGIIITNFAGSTITLATNAQNSSNVTQQVYCPSVQGKEEYIYTRNDLPTGAIYAADPTKFFPGDIWILSAAYYGFYGGPPRKFKCITAGYLSPITIGQTKQSYWIETYDTEFKINSSGIADFSVLIPKGTFIKGWRLIATTAGMTVTTGTTNGGTDIDPGTPITVGVSSIVNYTYYADADILFYFNGISGSGGTLNINFF